MQEIRRRCAEAALKRFGAAPSGLKCDLESCQKVMDTLVPFDACNKRFCSGKCVVEYRRQVGIKV